MTKEKTKKKPAKKSSGFQKGHKKLGGKKKGSKNKKTILREEALIRYQQTMLENLMPLTRAQQKSAEGLVVVLRPSLVMDHKTKELVRKGELKRVTDPDEIEELLNSDGAGKDYHIVFAKDPNPKAIQDIFDRLFGKAKEQIDLNFKAKELLEIQDGIRKIIEKNKKKK